MRLDDTLSGVRTGYFLQQKSFQNTAIDHDLSKALRQIWSSGVPSKIDLV